MDEVVKQVLETQHGLRLLRRIGRGGFAEVWEARTAQEVPCAIKVSLDPLDGQNPQIQKELQQLELLKGLVGHPHVVSLTDVWLIGGYLVTRWEFAPEGSLEDRLKQYQAEGHQGIPLEPLLRYIYDAAQGIDFLNGQGIVHRDIKPSNLLLFYNRVKVGDLGLAKFVGASSASHTGAGTFGYLPPEAYGGRLSQTVDLYSLAATYVKLRTGREPFGDDPVEIVERQKAGRPILDGLRPQEAEVVREALHPDPARRPQQGAVAWVRQLYQALKASKQSPPPTPAELSQPPVEVASASHGGQKDSIQELIIRALGGAIYGAIGGAIFCAIVGAIEEGLKRAIFWAIGGAIGGAIGEAIGGAIGEAIGGAIVCAIVGAIVGAMEDADEAE